MSRVKAPACPHPKCNARMIRAYVREGGSSGRFIARGWVCPECGQYSQDGSPRPAPYHS